MCSPGFYTLHQICFIRRKKTRKMFARRRQLTDPNKHLEHFSYLSAGPRTGLKPMQPMQLHWAPRVWGPRPVVFGHVVHFCQILFALANCTNRLLISVLANNYLVWRKSEFPLNYRTLSNILSVISALHHVPLFMDGTWLLVVAVKTAVDLQILQIKCVVIQLAANRSIWVFVIVATSPVKWRWLCDSPRTGCARRTTIHYVVQTSNNRVIMACELYCCLLPQSEALRMCRSGFSVRNIALKCMAVLPT